MKTSVKIPPIQIPEFKLSIAHILVVVFLVLWINSCRDNNSLKSEYANREAFLTDSLETKFDKDLNAYVSSRTALIGSEKESLELLLDASRDSTQQLAKLVKKYKRVNAALNVQTSTELPDIDVPYQIDGALFSKTFEVQDPFYSLSGVSSNDGLVLSDIKIPNTQSVVIGRRKKNFFKSEIKVDVVNSNPYIKTTGLDAFAKEERIKRFGVGPLIGYGYGKEGGSVFLGAGLSYDLIRF